MDNIDTALTALDSIDTIETKVDKVQDTLDDWNTNGVPQGQGQGGGDGGGEAQDLSMFHFIGDDMTFDEDAYSVTFSSEVDSYDVVTWKATTKPDEWSYVAF